MTQPSGPTDEQLQRIGLTRERWERIQIELGRREARAPKPGDPAPDSRCRS